MLRALFLLVLASLGAFACVPFALPPLRVEVAGSEASGSPPSDTPAQGAAVEDTPDLDLRAGVHPQQLVESQGSRVVDVGAGYGLATRGAAGRRTLRHGPYAELGVYPAQVALRGGQRLRAGLVGIGEWYPREGGGAGTVAVSGEISGFSAGAFSTGNAVGIAMGEWALGGFAGLTIRDASPRSSIGATAGLSLRLPLVVGVACCASPSDAVHANSRRHRAREKRRREPGRRSGGLGSSGTR